MTGLDKLSEKYFECRPGNAGRRTQSHSAHLSLTNVDYLDWFDCLIILASTEESPWCGFSSRDIAIEVFGRHRARREDNTERHSPQRDLISALRRKEQD